MVIEWKPRERGEGKCLFKYYDLSRRERNDTRGMRKFQRLSHSFVHSKRHSLVSFSLFLIHPLRHTRFRVHRKKKQQTITPSISAVIYARLVFFLLSSPPFHSSLASCTRFSFINTHDYVCARKSEKRDIRYN